MQVCNISRLETGMAVYQTTVRLGTSLTVVDALKSSRSFVLSYSRGEDLNKYTAYNAGWLACG